MVNMRRLGLTPVNDPVTTLVYHGHAKDVDMVLIDGKVVVAEGVVQSADEEDLVSRAGLAADAAWTRFAERYGGYSVRPPN
jgi:5-methylthioadenosine/S-adenosylhomocysteine deaminase